MHSRNDPAIDARMRSAAAVIRDAGALASACFRDLAALEVETKGNGQDLVSDADRAVERLIRDRLGRDFPDDGFLGEEYGLDDGTSGFVWVIDPIDGTSCFLHGSSTWCIAIALVRDNRTLAGMIYDPNAGELFSAVEGRGADLNGTAISVDPATDLQHGLTSVGANFRVEPRMISGFIHALLEAGGMFVRSGSGALSIAHVACGRLAAYYEPHMNAWDCLAAQCIVVEAGGWASDFLSESGLTRGGRVVACAPQLREPILALIDESARARP